MIKLNASLCLHTEQTALATKRFTNMSQWNTYDVPFISSLKTYHARLNEQIRDVRFVFKKLLIYLLDQNFSQNEVC